MLTFAFDLIPSYATALPGDSRARAELHRPGWAAGWLCGGGGSGGGPGHRGEELPACTAHLEPAAAGRFPREGQVLPCTFSDHTFIFSNISFIYMLTENTQMSVWVKSSHVSKYFTPQFSAEHFSTEPNRKLGPYVRFCPDIVVKTNAGVEPLCCGVNGHVENT